jgi:hypothetical protein
MSFHDWAPISLIQRINEYDAFLADDSNSKNIKFKQIASDAEMWRRLATRPEMKEVWLFISGLTDTRSLTTNGGLIGVIGRELNSYRENPKFTVKEYELEMLAIAKLAKSLSKKLQKFSEPHATQNPFRFSYHLNSEQLEKAGDIIKSELLEGAFKKSNIAHLLDSHMPNINSQLNGLERRAKDESKEQYHRIKLPRRTRDKNVYRTHFISLIKDYFFREYADYSPSRISIFCSVALDDSEISLDLVRKLFPLDDESKHLLMGQKI